MRVNAGVPNPSASQFHEGWPAVHPRRRWREHGPTLPDGEGEGDRTGNSAIPDISDSTRQGHGGAADRGGLNGSQPGDLIARATELQLLIAEAASRRLTPEQADAIAELVESLRTLLDEDPRGAPLEPH